MSQKQITISKEIHCEGIGVHSGAIAHLTLKPAEENTGIIFHRTDITDKDNIIKTSFDQVVDTQLGTTIANSSGVEVRVIEHFMSAIFGSNIDNLIIETQGNEIPIMDGSAEPFVFLLASAGEQVQNAPKQFIKILQEIEYQDGDITIKATPADEFSLHEIIDFPNTYIGKQEYNFVYNSSNYKFEIARARTFGFYKDLEYLKSIGLGRGASLDNAIGVDDNGVMNPEGLRFDNEFVRHKMLDFMGDMMTSQHRLLGKFFAYKAGHTSHNAFLRLLSEKKDCWQLVTIE